MRAGAAMQKAGIRGGWRSAVHERFL